MAIFQWSAFPPVRARKSPFARFSRDISESSRKTAGSREISAASKEVARQQAQRTESSRSDLTLPELKFVVQQVEALVLLHLPERLSDQRISKMCGIESRTLQSAFQKICGTTPYLALRSLRVKEVKRRLDRNDRLPMRVAMRQCGFGSYMGFTGEFQKQFGMDPKSFRVVDVASGSTFIGASDSPLPKGKNTLNKSGNTENNDGTISTEIMSLKYHPTHIDSLGGITLMERRPMAR